MERLEIFTNFRTATVVKDHEIERPRSMFEDAPQAKLQDIKPMRMVSHKRRNVYNAGNRHGRWPVLTLLVSSWVHANSRHDGYTPSTCSVISITLLSTPD